MIDIDYLKQLLSIFDESSANDLRIEQDGTSIKLSKSVKSEERPAMASYGYPAIQMPTPNIGQAPLNGGATGPTATGGSTVEVAGSGGSAASAAVDSKNYHEIRSPIVGTFYRAPSPDAGNYVEVGQSVSPGAVLCIVEAMKLMNEIECDAFGKIAKILVENAQPVEYNQVLFLIESE
jgi:acetyl-CoA carboxylase biotin carboxyl carrier protein